jgi:hypothetical protein
MRIVFALAVFTMSAPAIAEEAPRTARPSRMAMFCTKSGQQTSGLTKVCYYDCAGSEGAIAVKAYDHCSRWTPRWRLNRTGQFGPSVISR